MFIVDGLWCIDPLIKNVHRDVLLLDITTDTAGHLGNVSLTWLDAWEIVFTRGVHKAYAGHI